MLERDPRIGPIPPSRESGHLILAVMIGLTVTAIMLTAAIQQWSVVERREKEEELIFRGNQYVKAIKRYQMEHGGAFPTSLELLIQPGPRRLRYIRKLFRDPLAPDGKWGILLADPSGRGFINPNALPPEKEGVPGLEDLGRGLRDSFNQKLAGAARTNELRKSMFEKRSGLFDEPTGDPEGKVSVTAPGQPAGPIVGVVSLYDESSFRRFRDTENYTEWTFTVFDLENQQQGQQQALTPVPTPGSGIGPGGAQTILGGHSGAVGGSTPLPFGPLKPGQFGNKGPRPPNQGKPPN
jgi:type II secretory pathway pseudopilin PulG